MTPPPKTPEQPETASGVAPGVGTPPAGRAGHQSHCGYQEHDGHRGGEGHQRWLRRILGSPMRRLVHPPGRILAPFVAPGMTVLEPGPGVGFFTVELARRVGPSGRVVAVDVRPEMLDELRRRAARADVLDRIDARLAPPDRLGLDDLAGTVDFAFACFMVHEVPDAGRFFTEVAAALRPGGTLLFAEPAGHVDAARFAAELRAAERAGLHVDAGHTRRPRIRLGRAAVLTRPLPA